MKTVSIFFVPLLSRCSGVDEVLEPERGSSSYEMLGECARDTHRRVQENASKCSGSLRVRTADDGKVIEYNNLWDISTDGGYKRLVSKSSNILRWCTTKVIRKMFQGRVEPSISVILPDGYEDCADLIEINKESNPVNWLDVRLRLPRETLYRYLTQALILARDLHKADICLEGHRPLWFTVLDGQVLLTNLYAVVFGRFSTHSRCENPLIPVIRSLCQETEPHLGKRLMTFIDAVWSNDIKSNYFDYDRWIRFFESTEVLDMNDEEDTFLLTPEQQRFWDTYDACVASARRKIEELGGKKICNDAIDESVCPPVDQVGFGPRSKCRHGASGIACRSIDGRYFQKSFSKVASCHFAIQDSCNEKATLIALSHLADQGMIPHVAEASIEGPCGVVSILVSNAGDFSFNDVVGEKKALIARLLEILKEVHKAGFVHRDIHEGNIVMRDIRNPATMQLIDFGSAMPMLDRRGRKLIKAVIRNELSSFIVPGIDIFEQFIEELKSTGLHSFPRYDYWIGKLREHEN